MKEIEFFKRIRGEIFGILGPSFVFLGSIISSIGIPNYSIMNYFVSELGNNTNPLALLFNICLTVGALCNFMLMMNLEGFTKTTYNWIGVRIAMFSSLCVALVGVFPMTNILPHVIFAFSFFLTGMFAMGFVTVGIWRDKSNSVRKWMIIPSLLVIISFILFLFYPSESYTEVYAGDLSIFTMSAVDRPVFWSVTFFEWMILLLLNGWIMFIGFYKFIGKNKLKNFGILEPKREEIAAEIIVNVEK